MMERSITRLTLGAAVLALALIASPSSLADGTPAGTVISNTATVDFEDVNGNPLQEVSNTVTTTVSTVGAVSINPNTATSNADPGDLVCYLHTVTNDGNDDDTIDVATASSQGWTVTVYEDTDGSGDYTAGVDVALADTNASGTPDTDVLGADGSMDILVCVAVPAGTANGTSDQTDITIDSDNDPTQTDAAADTTTVDAPSLAVVKSVLPAGDQPPGTVLTYTVQVTNNGAGAAQNMVLTDPIPANTTYQAGTITQDAAARTDASDGDNADHNVTNPGEITVNIGTLASGASTTITFQVQID
jgi:uncharacterized repeat protein (TIGR01451 family)